MDQAQPWSTRHVLMERRINGESANVCPEASGWKNQIHRFMFEMVDMNLHLVVLLCIYTCIYTNFEGNSQYDISICFLQNIPLSRAVSPCLFLSATDRLPANLRTAGTVHASERTLSAFMAVLVRYYVDVYIYILYVNTFFLYIYCSLCNQSKTKEPRSRP